MALTTNQLIVGMFNMAAGGYTTLVSDFIDANGVDAAADALLGGSGLNPQFLGANLYDNEQFSANLIAQLMTGAGSSLQAAVAKIVKDYMDANASLSRGAVVVDVIEALMGVSTSDTTLGSYVTAFNAKVALADAYAGTSTDFATLAAVVGGTSTSDMSLSLTINATGNAADNLSGGIGNDTFTARIFNNSNSLESGDVLTGGSGTDTLFADIGASQDFAITAETTGIETVQIRAQSQAYDDPDNNMQSSEVQIDAQRMVGVTKWEANNGRADLIIEDVRILDDQITKDITIAMVETDPGHVDYGVYFDPYSLRSGSSATSQLELELLDTRSQAAGTGPLKDNPYWGFGFYLNGEAKIITSTAIDAALTYADLLTAIQGAITTAAATDSDLAGLTASLGSTFNRYDTESGALVQGTSIILTDSNGGVMAIDSNVGWQTQTGTVPPSSGIHTNIEPYDPVTTVDLITSKVILDDVGRGSMGGDLVIGSLSVGDTSSSKGVERFEIEVRDNSRLQTINSTNNTLQEVTIVNGTTTSHNLTPKHTGVATTQNAGSLTVNGKVGADSTINQDMEGAEAQQDSGFGFSDVRLIDGSAMTGSLNFTAEVTSASIAKYLSLVDTASSPSADNIAFQYYGGSNNDTITVDIDGTAAGSTSTNSGREDFSFTVAGGSGNDSITVSLDGNGSTNWYGDQAMLNNVTISGGSGNDTIRKPGSGDVIIDASTGNDTVYSDNSGTVAAKWLISSVNTDDTDLLGQNGATAATFMYDGKLKVTLSGSSAGDAAGVTDGASVYLDNGWEVEVSIPTDTNYAVTQYHINQAIKAAINGDAVLSKLLLAVDGPADSLVISSLIDGAFEADDLIITVSSTDITTLTGATQTAVVTDYQEFSANSAATAANAQTANAASVLAFNAVNGMDTNQVLAGGSSIQTAISVTTQGVTAVKEVFTATFAATTDADSITFDGLGAHALAGGSNATANATDYATWYNLQGGATWVAVDNGNGTVTFTNKTAAAVVDVTTANFVITSGGGGADTAVTAAAPTTDGVTAVKEVFTATFTGTAQAGETLTFDGATTAALAAADTGGTIAAAVDANGDTVWTSAVAGNVVTFTAAAAGAIADVTAAAFVSNQAAATGGDSTATTDNIIDMGSGTDVLALSSSAFANEVVRFTATSDIDTTVVNFEDGNVVATSLDVLDFTTYLTSMISSSGSTASQARVATSLNADAVAEVNSVTIISTANFTTTDTFAGLTSAQFLDAVNGTDAGYASIVDANLGAKSDYAASGANTLVGGVGRGIVLVENDDNDGEYAIFQLNWTGTGSTALATTDFTSASLIGYVDFGDSLGITVTNLA